MCGRYYRKGDKQKIAEAFHASIVDDGTPSPPWDYNVAPTTIQPVIRANRDSGERELVSMRWGLVPFFTKSINDIKGISTINAKAETVAKSPTYRTPFQKRRCLVPASGFYEWKREGKDKQPFAFDLLNGHMMAFAGLWDAWKDPANGQWLQSYTIITTDANELMAAVHNRMPVILHPGDYDRWLSREQTHQPPIDLLRPFPADEMEAFEVGKDIGNVRNNSPELLNRI